MFTPSHMAIGALVQAGLKRKLPTAVVALASHALLDNTKIWHAYEYSWPSGTPMILQIFPYPHDVPSILTVVVLVIATIAVAFLLRHYWWGMLWSLAPDIIDWLVVRPITGREPIHDFIKKFQTPWGIALEIAFIVFITIIVLRKKPALS